MTTRWAALPLGLMLAISPDLALACSVCSGGTTEQTQLAFLSATLFMTALPLSMIALGGLALRRRLKQMAAEEAADSPRS